MKNLFRHGVALLVFVLLVPAAAQAVTLRWTDNSNNEDGFKIERAPEMGSSLELTSCSLL